jgi:hypothetical protein
VTDGPTAGCAGLCCAGACQQCCTDEQCATPNTCGGGGTPGECGCTPDCDGASCGDPDGCGGVCVVQDCPAPRVCTVNGTCAYPCNADQAVCDALGAGCACLTPFGEEAGFTACQIINPDAEDCFATPTNCPVGELCHINGCQAVC